MQRIAWIEHFLSCKGDRVGPGRLRDPHAPILGFHRSADHAEPVVIGFAPEVVSIVSTIEKSATSCLAADSDTPLADQTQWTLHQKLECALTQCLVPLAHKKSVLDAQQRVSDRIAVIKRSLASSGVGACLLEADQDQMNNEMQPEILLEMEVISPGTGMASARYQP